MSDQPTVKLFYSYSHKDEDLRNQLDTHLKLLQRQKVIDVWHDRKIGAGTEWKDAIDDNLEAADIILLLISADFLASDYCFDVEIKRAMEKHHDQSAVVIPVSLRPCDVVDVDFMKLQGLPKDFKPVIKWEHQDEAFTDIAKGIREAANRIRNNNKNHVLSSQNATDMGKLAMSPTNTKTILIAAANPSNETRLRLDIETRDIDEGLRLSKYRERFVLKQQWATRVRDLRRAMNENPPAIVHFCGHGAGEEGIVLEDNDGKTQLVSTEALANFFELFADEVECVVLNACFSEVQAKEIAKHIPYVVGMAKSISDKAAIEFAVAFYDSLAAGKDYEKAYKLGCSAIEMQGISGHWLPQLFKKENYFPKLRPPLLDDKPKRRATVFNVPIPRNPFFTGRADILAKLHEALQSQNEIAIKPSDKATALSGLGGVGKTQTVAEYAHRYQDDYSAVLWVLSDGKDLLRSSFANLSPLLGFKATRLPTTPKISDDMSFSLII